MAGDKWLASLVPKWRLSANSAKSPACATAKAPPSATWASRSCRPRPAKRRRQRCRRRRRRRSKPAQVLFGETRPHSFGPPISRPAKYAPVSVATTAKQTKDGAKHQKRRRPERQCAGQGSRRRRRRAQIGARDGQAGEKGQNASGDDDSQGKRRRADCDRMQRDDRRGGMPQQRDRGRCRGLRAPIPRQGGRDDIISIARAGTPDQTARARPRR